MAAQHRVPVILTRPRAQAERFAAALDDGMVPVFSPLLEIAFLPIPAPPRTDETILLTSENGAHALAAAGAITGQRALCVGARTCQVARDLGLAATSAEGAVKELLALCADHAGPFVHLRGVHTRGDLAPQLEARGQTCREVVAYDQRPCPLSQEARKALTDSTPCLVPLFSPRTAALFASQCPAAPNAHLICMSGAVAKATTGGSYASRTTAPSPNAAQMHAQLHAQVRAIRLEGGKTTR